MRILVTGSRELVWRATVFNVLSSFAPARTITIVCGYDPVRKIPTGADQFAWEWATTHRRDAKPECHPADWKRQCDANCYHRPRFRPETIDGTEILVPYCPVAGNLRNQEMVDSVDPETGERAEVCVAFYKQGGKNRGTRDCVRRAREAGIEVRKTWERA